ncbi:hypothetical protein RU86_GL002283 [Lactococcus piscium]|uniref:HEPN like Abia C-terminal domain-containing protein n=1 Tax=Pseudolactococcus piscium TaxID=1364 RepID=A0A2A5S074_9LACT|nr:AbiA family abortive infection protein [Lactococcus piscium]PCS06840.1 hypothetical protein RU86_GL002283 [Lactococcus piscium]
MISLEYKDWERACKMLRNIPMNSKNKYFQTYSFYKLSVASWKKLFSQNFFNTYIKSGEFLTYNYNLSFADRLLQKNNGSYRHVRIVSPIIYLFLIAIASQIERLYEEKRTENIAVFFSGNFNKENESAHYKNSYEAYLIEINTCQDSYKYYFKIDFSTFFPLIDTDILFNKIDNLDPKSALIYSSIIKMIGQGKMPIIDGNSGLSYLNTVIYLDDFDTAVIDYLNKLTEIGSFRLVRYVDDLYIFINCDESKLELLNYKIYNHLCENSVKNHVELNSSKTEYLTSTSGLGERMNSDLYDFFVNSTEINFNDYFSKEDLKLFLERLLELPEHASYEEYASSVLSTFKNDEFVFENEYALNAIVYNKKSWVKDDEIQEIIEKIINLNYHKLRYAAKALITLILNTRNGEIIKALLNKLFTAYSDGNGNIVDEILSIEYLVQRNFKHTNLMNVIKNVNPDIVNYISNYQLHDFFNYIENNRTTYYTKENESYLKLANDPNINFLYFRYKYFEALGQTLESFAYFKNYFDRFIAHAQFCLGKDGDKKPNYKGYYKEGDLKKAIKLLQIEISDDDVDNILTDAHKMRNNNPVSHSSANILKNSDFKKTDILNSIKNLNKILMQISSLITQKKDN